MRYTFAMKSGFSITPVILALLISVPAYIAQADDDYLEAKRLRDRGEIKSLEEILKNARRAYPGRILEVELEDEEGRIIYELEILGHDSIVRKIHIDARSGQLLFVEEDD
jgi:uncharacterized membrane protein YkoI